jgi:glycosyltransferase involved in cell wall biosynthesis
MKITVYTVCFNEELMLPHFLNHYSRIAHKIVVYDNQSTDNSMSLVRDYSNVEVHSFNTGGRFSELTLTSIRENCWRNDNADYVIVCDVDEFLYCDNVDLPEFLSARADYSVFQPLGFEMVADQFPKDYTRSIHDQVQVGVYSRGYSKMVLFDPNRICAMNFSPGSHCARPIGRLVNIYRADRRLGKATGYDLKLLHYKNLGFEYRESRHRCLAKRLRTDALRARDYGFHYALEKREQLAQFRKLRRRAYNCVKKSVPSHLKIRMFARRMRERKLFCVADDWTRA